jgi:hypothetical protein
MKFAKYSFLVNVINEDCKIIDPVNKSDPLHQTYELTERSKYGLQVLNLWYPESKAVVIIIHPQNTGPRARRLESIERSKSTQIDFIVPKKRDCNSDQALPDFQKSEPA